MRFVLALAAFILLGCAEGNSAPKAPLSPCKSERFEGAGFIVCTPASTAKLKLFAAARAEAPKLRFGNLGLTDRQVDFAMNAGMYGVDRRPIGLTIVEGRTIRPIALRPSRGNFGMKPNGVFLVRKSGKAEILVSESVGATGDIRIATQSGPMLVIGGKLHPKFAPDGDSRQMRNGVGVTEAGTARFVMSADPVSLGKFARFFRDRLKTPNALYFDGSVSSLWVPADGRMDDFEDLGPIIVALR